MKPQNLLKTIRVLLKNNIDFTIFYIKWYLKQYVNILYEGNDIQDFNIELDDDGQITLSLE